MPHAQLRLAALPATCSRRSTCNPPPQAGPGSGKTRALVSRVLNLIWHWNVEAERVLAITFTNKVRSGFALGMKQVFLAVTLEPMCMGA